MQAEHASSDCLSVRRFKIRLRVPRGEEVRKAIVKVDGKKVAVKRGKRLTAIVDLRGLPKLRYRVGDHAQARGRQDDLRRPPLLDLHAGDPLDQAARACRPQESAHGGVLAPMRRLAVSTVLALLALAAPAAAQDAHSPNLSHVKTLPYEARNGDDAELRAPTSSSRRSAGASTRWPAPTTTACRSSTSRDPDAARIVAVYDCGVTQGDPQVFTRGERTYATYTSDTFGDGTSTCYREAAALGFDAIEEDGTGRNGTFIADITDPLAPATVSFVPVEQGSHNQTVHPSGNYLYNSNADLITSVDAGDRGLRHLRPRAAAQGRRAGAPDAARPRHRVARHHLQRGRRPRLLGGALAGRDHRHHRPGARRSSSRASSTRRSTSGTSPTRSRSPTRAARGATS